MLNEILSKWITYKLLLLQKCDQRSENRIAGIGEQIDGNDLLAWKIICSLFSHRANQVGGPKNNQEFLQIHFVEVTESSESEPFCRMSD
jgi:hypothetical protein